MWALVLLAPAFADDAALVKALSVRDPAPDCARVEALAVDPVPALLRVIDTAPHPPWVAIRAAECLVTRHATEIEAQMTSWMADAEKKGLGLVALAHLDGMEPALATRLASAALAGPYADTARPRIERARVVVP
jgi:hypothetical protein